MSGGALGGTAGTALGIALAPETGGLSMAIPAIAGAAGGYLGGKLGGDKNPLMDALMGGIGGGLGGASGLGSALGIGDVGGVGDSISSSLPSWMGGATADSEALSPAVAAADAAAAPGAMSANTGVNAATDNLVNNMAASQVAASPSSAGSGIGSYLAKQNPLSLALAGTTGLSAIQALMPHPQVNVGQNVANTLATNPGFNATLPKYALQNTATPYSGNWYTYGETPQAPMYNAQPVLQQAQGGLVGYAKGGPVRRYAMGGPAMHMASSAPPMPQQAAPMMSSQAAQQPQIPVNPLTLKAAHQVGVAIGQHLKSKIHTPDGQVQGPGGGQDDAIPARLSQDEFVIPADVTAHLGDGSSNAGGKALTKLIHNVRAHKVSKGAAFPPKARNPLSYLPKKAKI